MTPRSLRTSSAAPVQRIERGARRHPRLAVSLLHRLEAAARAAGDHALALDALYQRYLVLERLGEAGGIVDDLYAGLQLAEDLGLVRQAGCLLEAIGRVRYTQGEYREAMHHWGRCIDMSGVTGDLRSGVEARIGLGAMHDALGEWETGARFHRDARALLGDVDDPYLSAKLALNLGVNQRSIGQLDSAVEQFEFALGEARRGGVREYVAESTWHLGQCAQHQRDLQRAESLMRSALDLAHACGFAWLIGAAQNSLAQVHLQQDKPDDAYAAYEEALRHATRIGSRSQQTACCSALSHLAERRGDTAAALRYARLHMALELEIKAELSAPDRLRDMQQYDLSRKPPVQKLLELSSSGAMQNPSELGPALQSVADASADILRVELVAVWLHDAAGGRTVCRALLGPEGLGFVRGHSFGDADMPSYRRWQAALRDALAVHDARLHPAIAELRVLFADADICSLLEVPLRLHGQTVGAVTFGQRGRRRSWTRDDVLFGSHIAHLIEHMLSDRQPRGLGVL